MDYVMWTKSFLTFVYMNKLPEYYADGSYKAILGAVKTFLENSDQKSLIKRLRVMMFVIDSYFFGARKEMTDA